MKQSEPINIIDIIITKHKQMFLVLDRMPVFKYTKKDNILVAEDSGFYSCYLIEHDRFAKAFGGRKFQIAMEDGSTLDANGQYWDQLHPIYKEKPTMSQGICTIKELNKCNVFISGQMDKELVTNWLDNHDHSDDYDKYEKRYE